MSYDDDMERWQNRAEMYRWRSLPAETHEAMRVANRMSHTVDLANGAMDAVMRVGEAADLAERRQPRSARAIRDIEATAYMALTAAVARYGFRP